MIASIEPRYVFNGREGSSLIALVHGRDVRLDPDGIKAAFGEKERADETCIAGARLLPARGPAMERDPRSVAPSALLERACDRLPPGRVALALSGGVDSATLLALLRERVTAFTLDARLAGYGEGDEAAAIARHLGLDVRRVEAHERDFVEALPEAIRLAETPLYNLHPVGRLLLARGAREAGFDVLVTGDGADEVFRGEGGADYLPVVGALMRGAGLQAFAPFLDPVFSANVARDSAKRALRVSATELGVPPAVAWQKKAPRYAPAFDVGRFLDRPLLGKLARALGRPLTLETDRDRVRFATLGLFARLVPGLEDACAE